MKVENLNGAQHKHECKPAELLIVPKCAKMSKDSAPSSNDANQMDSKYTVITNEKDSNELADTNKSGRDIGSRFAALNENSVTIKLLEMLHSVEPADLYDGDSAPRPGV